MKKYTITTNLNNYIMGFKLFIMIIAIFIYLMNADLSEAPEFIYNQF